MGLETDQLMVRTQKHQILNPQNLRLKVTTIADLRPQKPNARLVAAHAIVNVLTKRMPLETALAQQDSHKDLSARDRAFARLIAATTFRRLAQIDAALKPYIKQIPPALVYALLRSGAAQMLYLGTPVHAAVGETVQVLKSRPHTKGFSGMANAVLRRVSENGKKLTAHVAPQENIPQWLRQSWEQSYGRTTMRKIAKALLADPPLDITVPDNPEAWADRLEATLLPGGTLRRPKIGDVSALPGFKEGAWWAQDISASLPVKLWGDIKGQTVLDMCAAPGGKTLQLAAKGAHVTALDRSENRATRISENLERTGLSAEIIITDAQNFDPHTHSTSRLFDKVLLDAPCTATGTFRRHPDVIYNKQAKDVKALADIQDALLAKAAQCVRPGGEIIYCTCSLQAEEGEDRIVTFLENMPDFRLIPILPTALSGLEACISETGYLRSYPHLLSEMGGMDGFFIARIIRNKS